MDGEAIIKSEIKEGKSEEEKKQEIMINFVASSLSSCKCFPQIGSRGAEELSLWGAVELWGCVAAPASDKFVFNTFQSFVKLFGT